MSEEPREIRIANITLSVPDDLGDEDLTREIVTWLNEQYEAEEKRVGRIDTPMVALSLAYRLAKELHKTREASEAQTEEFRDVLDKLASQIESLTRKA